MNVSLQIAEFLSDLSAFADIGTDLPSSTEERGQNIIRFVRSGEPTEIVFYSNGMLLERFGEEEIRHANVRALFASNRYGSVREWAVKQSLYLAQELDAEADRIEVKAMLDDNVGLYSLDQIDDRLFAPQNAGSSRVMLIDGPAGIGKTYFILELAARRAQNFAKTRRPLLLHVQSRGRTLSNIYDLIAFSLQRLRVNVTYDQVPVLAKHGLITIAIDGFDELADPDGYDLAWGQVSDLVEGLRGSGSIILAGRETFIGRARVIKDIASLRPDKDDIAVATLNPPSKAEALRWLGKKGWTEQQRGAIEPFLEPSSLALRPFFLATLSDPGVAEQLSTTESTNILSILMDAMIEREIGKFGDQIEAAISANGRRKYIRDLMGEAAREMAESGSIAISDATLSFLADVVAPEGVPETIVRILKARSQSIAFLTNDERRGHRKFFHEKFYEYFLSRITIDFISSGHSSKFISRGIFGSSFLETFGTIVSGGMSSGVAEFLNGALTMMSSASAGDRTRKNMVALILSALPVMDTIGEVELDSFEIEDARITGTCSRIKISDALISQIDCRGADLSAIIFENTTVLTLIADPLTIVPNNFPNPTRIQDISQRSISDPVAIKAWLAEHVLAPASSEGTIFPLELREHPAVRLLQRACRIRQYWLRRSNDIFASRILDDENWQLLEELLQKHNLLRVEYRQASGSDARFIHVRQGEELLAFSGEDSDVRDFYRDLAVALSN